MEPEPLPRAGLLATLGTRGRAVVRWDAALVLALVAVLIFGQNVSGQFLNTYNLFTTCTNMGDLALMAIPMTLIILTGEIDLSVASVLALSAEVMGSLWSHHWSMGLIFLVVLAIGALCGLVNGILITRVGLPSLAVTIGTLTLYRGLADVVLGPTEVSNFPVKYTNVGVNGFFGLPWLSDSVAAFLIIAVLTGIVLKWTAFGRSIYAIGLNEEAAYHNGIRVKRIKLGLYVFSGMVCAAVGVLYAFELSSAAENIGLGFELQVVTIVLLGGVSIFGGRGTILGVVLAAVIYSLLRTALLLTGSINENDFQIVSGGLLIISVLLPNLAEFTHRGRALLRRRPPLDPARQPAAQDLGESGRV